jgi:hypothetical protein
VDAVLDATIQVLLRIGKERLTYVDACSARVSAKSAGAVGDADEEFSL